jgi:hypothetical protein
MMPQRSENESIYEHDESSYGRYEGNQTFTNSSEMRSEAQYPSETTAEKVYPQLHNQKNILRIGMFMLAMVMILVFALLFIFFLGGTGGWISFCVAAGIIFLLTVIIIDKIE